jgi:plastocyanin
MANSNSIFYKIGDSVQQKITTEISANNDVVKSELLNGNNKWGGTNDFQNSVTAGTYAEFTLTTGGENVRVAAIATGTYTSFEIKSSGATDNAVSIVEASAGVWEATCGTTTTVADLVAAIIGVAGPVFFASTDGAGTGTVSILAPQNVQAGKDLEVRNNIAITGNANITGDAVITGNLQVDGTTTTISTTNLDVSDNFINLSKGASGGAFNKDSGFYFERASGSAPAVFVWDESEDEFVLGLADDTGIVYNTSVTGNGTDYTFSGDLTGNDPAISLEEGDTLIVDNTAGAVSHPFVIEDGSSNQVGSDNGSGVYTFTATTAGAYTYRCTSHPSMTGTITVAAGDTSSDEDTVTVSSTSASTLRVGKLSVTDQTLNQTLELGDFSDFEAGLA